jgi:hypothetical protein
MAPLVVCTARHAVAAIGHAATTMDTVSSRVYYGLSSVVNL